MRIALLPVGSRGDVHPMIALGRKLRDASHDVVVGTAPQFRDDVVRAGLGFVPVGRDARDYISANAREYTAGVLRGALVVHRHLMEEVDVQFRDVPRALEGRDLAVGAGLQLAAASVSEAMGIAYRYVAYCPALLQSREHAPILLPITRIPRFLHLPTWSLLRSFYARTVGPRIDRHRRLLGLGPVHDLYAHVLGREPILATDVEIAPIPVDAAPRPVATGYISPEPDEGARLPEHVERFLESGAPPVYVGFGSMGCPDPRRTTREIVEALRRVGARGVLSRGWAGLGDVPLPDGMIAVDDVPHSALFPRMAAVVHHGGAGTTATTARAGVPQVVIPHIADQFFWGERVHGAGVGARPVARDTLTAARLSSALDGLLRDHATQRRAEELGRTLRARSGADRAARALVASHGVS